MFPLVLFSDSQSSELLLKPYMPLGLGVILVLFSIWHEFIPLALTAFFIPLIEFFVLFKCQKIIKGNALLFFAVIVLLLHALFLAMVQSSAASRYAANFGYIGSALVGFGIGSLFFKNELRSRYGK